MWFITTQSQKYYTNIRFTTVIPQTYLQSLSMLSLWSCYYSLLSLTGCHLYIRHSSRRAPPSRWCHRIQCPLHTAQPAVPQQLNHLSRTDGATSAADPLGNKTYEQVFFIYLRNILWTHLIIFDEFTRYSEKKDTFQTIIKYIQKQVSRAVSQSVSQSLARSLAHSLTHSLTHFISIFISASVKNGWTHP